MPKKLLFMLSGIAIGIALTAGVVLAGSLTPPAGPTGANAQMYTLGQLYDRLTTGANGSKATTYTEPGSDPAATMYSLDDIMTAAPARDDSDGVTASEVAAGRTFWGLRSDGWSVLTGTLTGVAGGVVMPTRQEQVKAAGYYSSPIVIPGDGILSPEYIKAGVELFGVEGVVAATNVYSTFVPKSGALVTGDIGAQHFFAHVRTYNTFNLSGRLLDPTGNPLVGVSLGTRSPVRSTPLVARTNANGVFIFANLPAQYYTTQNVMTGERSGLTTAQYTLFPVESYSGGYSINHPPISSSNGVDVNLDIYATTTRTGHTITGRVTDGSGNGIPDVTIHQDRQAYYSPYAQHTAKTDAAGYYTMTVRTEPATEEPDASLVVYLRPSKRGLDFTPATLLVNGIEKKGEPPLTFTGKNFAAAAAVTTYDISGRIMTRGYDSLGGVIGVPLANVILSDGTQTVTTGAAGDYVLADVPGGVYVITPTLDGYYFSPPTISVLAAPPTTTPVAGEDSDLQKGQEWPGPRFTDNNDGTVTDNLTGLVWLKEGNCFGLQRFNAAVGAVATLTSGQCGLSGGNLGGQNFAGAATAATATIFGRVTDANGAVILNPFDSSQPVSISVAAGAASALIDESGYYTLTGVPYGPQTVTASVVGNNTGEGGTPARFEFAPAQRLVMANQSQIFEQNFVGTEVFTVTGRITNGTPLAGATVRAGDRWATTDANGYYTMTVPRGRYNFTPFRIGYSFDPASADVSISGIRTINFSYAPTAATGWLVGYVVDADGNPLPSNPLPNKTQALRIYYSYRKADGTTQSGNSLPVNSGEDMGRYDWSGIPLGAVVTVTPTLAYHVFTPLTTTVVITGPTVIAPNFVARPAYDLGGRIVDGSSNPLAGVTVSNGAQVVTTNASGYYTFTSQPIGDYVLTASQSGYSIAPTAITATLSHNSLPGNWRMPNARELHSLVSFGYAAPALADSTGAGHWSSADPFVFSGINDWAVDDSINNNILKWWTSTEAPTTNALTVHFNSGALLWTDKGDDTAYCPGSGNLLCHSYLWPVWDVPEP